jgi:hypothetical protein
MPIPGFHVREQAESGGLLSFQFEFLVQDSSVCNIRLTFVADISERKSGFSKNFQVEAVYRQEVRDSGVFVIVDVKSFTLTSQLNYDELTSFGAFELTGGFADGFAF